MTAAYMDACKDRPADWNEIGYWYFRKAWDARSISASGAMVALRTLAEFPVTDLLLNMDAANMRRIAANALAGGRPESSTHAGSSAITESQVATPAAAEAPAVQCVHDWRPFYTSVAQSHEICAKCEAFRPWQSAEPVQQERKPLTLEQIKGAAVQADCKWLMGEYTFSLKAFARAIEAVHGITAATDAKDAP